MKEKLPDSYRGHAGSSPALTTITSRTNGRVKVPLPRNLVDGLERQTTQSGGEIGKRAPQVRVTFLNHYNK